MVSTLCQNLFKKTRFCQKAQNFVHLGRYDLFKNSPACEPYVSKKLWRDFKLPVLAFATLARKIFHGKFAAEIDFPFRSSILITITDADIGSLKSFNT